MTLSRMLDARRGPAELVLVRHGESMGNVADAQARDQNADRLELSARDADVELTENGRRQAAAVGKWLAGADEDSRPTVVLCSPYRRAAETAELAVRGLEVERLLDERLRERDLGVFDGLTGAGIRAEYPAEAERRKKLGKFYYQPPSGESWADVALRIRSLLADLRDGFDGARVWLFTHQAVIMSFRYVLEGLTEQELLEIDAETQIGNASMTCYRRGEEGYELVAFADTTAVGSADVDADVTHEEQHSGRGTAGDEPGG
jgi:broad specificity phosphatase PhoE